MFNNGLIATWFCHWPYKNINLDPDNKKENLVSSFSRKVPSLLFFAIPSSVAGSYTAGNAYNKPKGLRLSSFSFSDEQTGLREFK